MKKFVTVSIAIFALLIVQAQNCPTSIRIGAPSQGIAGDTVVFIAQAFGFSGPVTYNWTISAGIIMSGQGTAMIMINTDSLAGQFVTVTVEVGGLPRECISTSSATVDIAAAKAKPVFVIVHGAWGGSWAFKKVDSLMTEKGGIVYRPSLTGMGERSHLSDPRIGLQMHINDVVNMILFEDLHNVILVGHSYGGMVITGVADSLPDRIKKIIYLDAFVPSDGESVLSILAPPLDEFIKKMIQGNFIIPAWLKPGTPLPHDVPQPVKTFSDSIVLKNRAKNISTVYILTVEKGKSAKDDDFALQAARAGKKGWTILQLEADHNPQWSAPEQLANLLFENK